MPTSAIGSPPHVRGKVGVTDIAPVSPRITPACAGKSTICGEWQQTFGGSPPHVRGKDMDTLQTVHDARITPACAGKSGPYTQRPAWSWDHPRMCGEKDNWMPEGVEPEGSPPHVRGKGIRFQRGCSIPGITPACAGKSVMFSIPWPVLTGSPPHVRGKGYNTLGAIMQGGITPACAGKRLKRSRSTVPPVAIVPLFPSVCNKPVVSDGSPAGRDAPLFLPAENAVPASPAYNLRSL